MWLYSFSALNTALEPILKLAQKMRFYWFSAQDTALEPFLKLERTSTALADRSEPLFSELHGPCTANPI